MPLRHAAPVLALVLSPLTQPLAQQPEATIRLWPDGPPGFEGTVQPETVVERGATGSNRFIRNVQDATLTVYLPPDAAGTKHAGVVICPGGGYGGLAIDKEGHDVARWLVRAGVAGLVLKYRMPRPAGVVFGHEAPLQDAHRALRTARAEASKWRLDPKRIGILGFSAGGHLAATAAVRFTAGDPDGVDAVARQPTRPDFCVLVYPVVTMEDGVTHRGSRRNLLGPEPAAALIERFSNERQVSERTPPTFLVHTQDDGVKVQNSLRFHAALVEAGVPSALHVFATGGHGYGLIQRGLPVDAWPDLCIAWLRARGIVDSKSKKNE